MARPVPFEPVEINILKDLLERHGAGVTIRCIADVLAFIVSLDRDRTEYYADLISKTHDLAREYERLWLMDKGI